MIAMPARLTLGIMAALALSAVADAVVIYDNGVTQLASSAPVSSATQKLAEDFWLLAGATTITDIHWTGRYASVPPGATPVDNFTIDIYAENNGAPGASPIKTWTASDYSLSRTASDFWYHYEAIVSPYELLPDTVYFLSIWNTPTNATFWAWGGQNSETRSYWLYTDQWRTSPGILDFQLTGVPEPATLALFGLGLAGIPLVRRRRTPA